ncbi:SPOR domain-containing protein, partial [Coralloluteibacterium thermophilus]
ASAAAQPAARAPAPAAAAAERAAPSAGFAVQVGAFRSEGDANALRDRLRGAGFSALVERAQTDAGTVFRVRAGPTANRAEADRLRAQLAERLQLTGNVVSYP